MATQNLAPVFQPTPMPFYLDKAINMNFLWEDVDGIGQTLREAFFDGLKNDRYSNNHTLVDRAIDKDFDYYIEHDLDDLITRYLYINEDYQFDCSECVCDATTKEKCKCGGVRILTHEEIAETNKFLEWVYDNARFSIEFCLDENEVYSSDDAEEDNECFAGIFGISPKPSAAIIDGYCDGQELLGENGDLVWFSSDCQTPVISNNVDTNYEEVVCEAGCTHQWMDCVASAWEISGPTNIDVSVNLTWYHKSANEFGFAWAVTVDADRAFDPSDVLGLDGHDNIALFPEFGLDIHSPTTVPADSEAFQHAAAFAAALGERICLERSEETVRTLFENARVKMGNSLGYDVENKMCDSITRNAIAMRENMWIGQVDGLAASSPKDLQIARSEVWLSLGGWPVVVSCSLEDMIYRASNNDEKALQILKDTIAACSVNESREDAHDLLKECAHSKVHGNLDLGGPALDRLALNVMSFAQTHVLKKTLDQFPHLSAADVINTCDQCETISLQKVVTIIKLLVASETWEIEKIKEAANIAAVYLENFLNTADQNQYLWWPGGHNLSAAFSFIHQYQKLGFDHEPLFIKTICVAPAKTITDIVLKKSDPVLITDPVLKAAQNRISQFVQDDKISRAEFVDAVETGKLDSEEVVRLVEAAHYKYDFASALLALAGVDHQYDPSDLLQNIVDGTASFMASEDLFIKMATNPNLHAKKQQLNDFVLQQKTQVSLKTYTLSIGSREILKFARTSPHADMPRIVNEFKDDPEQLSELYGIPGADDRLIYTTVMESHVSGKALLRRMNPQTEGPAMFDLIVTKQSHQQSNLYGIIEKYPEIKNHYPPLSDMLYVFTGRQEVAEKLGEARSKQIDMIKAFSGKSGWELFYLLPEHQLPEHQLKAA